MTNIEKCKAALAQGLRVQMLCIGEDGAQWEQRLGIVFTGSDSAYRIHPDDEARFVAPAATPTKHQNLSTRTINGRTYTHRSSMGGICRIICRDLISTHTIVAAILRGDGTEITALFKSEDSLTPGTDPSFDVDWSKVAMDTPLWGHGWLQPTWRPGHFAGLDPQGRVTVFDGGRTSHTTAHTTAWQEARLAKPE